MDKLRSRVALAVAKQLVKTTHLTYAEVSDMADYAGRLIEDWAVGGVEPERKEKRGSSE